MSSLSHTHSAITHPQITIWVPGLLVKTHVKAGGPGLTTNHNETLVQASRPTAGLKVKTHVKAGIKVDY